MSVKKAFYSVSSSQDWKRAAAILQDEGLVKPVFWTLSTNEVVEFNKDVISLSYTDIITSNFKGVEFLSNIHPIDSDIIEEFRKEIYASIKMMDRLDPLHNFSFSERHRFAIKLLNFSLNVVKYLQPDIAIFNEVPHHAPQYLLYSVFQKRKIGTIFFRPFYIYNKGYKQVLYDYTKTHRFKATKDIQLATQIEAYYQGKVKKDITPDYMKEQEKEYSFKRIIKTIIGKTTSISRLFDKKYVTTFEKLDSHSIYDSESVPFYHLLSSVRGNFFKQKLRKEYIKLSCSSTSSLSDKFILVPLHYQPERTTSPEGGIFADQILMIQLIRSCIPKDWKIYVKEHLSQFHYKGGGHMGRTIDYYQRIKEMGNIEFLDLNSPLKDYIVHSQAVATVTGTVGIESLFLKKKTFVFGEGCWFKTLPGIYFIKNKTDIIYALNDDFDYDNLRVDILTELQKIIDNTFDINFYPNKNNFVDENNANNLILALRSVILSRN